MSEHTHDRFQDVLVTRTSHWEWFTGQQSVQEGIKGKYLFFSPHRESLQAIALREIGENAFPLAKVCIRSQSVDGDFVLCLYNYRDDRGGELRERYPESEELRYRWWKSDRETNRGMYSECYLKDKKGGE